MNIIDFIFPKRCLECGKEGKYICEGCLAKVGRGGISKDHISIFRYEGVIRKAIIALKYKFSTEIANELAETCVKHLGSDFHVPASSVLAPVPLHWYRQNLRGFNQSEEVGKLIAKQMGWKFIPNLLIKKKPTKSQVELKGADRRKNLRRAFSLNANYQTLDSNCIVFDDVYTTGSTLKEAIKVLRVAGAQKVWGLTIAR